jgi:tetratricopeptide (TPR) repeat protein
VDGTPETLLNRGLQARREHRIADARRSFEDAITAARQGRDAPTLAQALIEMGRLERDQHELNAARRYYEDAANIYRTLNNPLRLAHTVRHVGDILQDAGKLSHAGPCYREALEIYRAHEQPPPVDLANTIRGYALLKGELRETREAIALWREARELYAAAHVQAGVLDCEEQIARLSRIA